MEAQTFTECRTGCGGWKSRGKFARIYYLPLVVTMSTIVSQENTTFQYFLWHFLILSVDCGRGRKTFEPKKIHPRNKKSWSLIGNKNAGTIGLKMKRLGNGWGFYILEFWYKMLKVLRFYEIQMYFILISKVLHSDIKGITFWYQR